MVMAKDDTPATLPARHVLRQMNALLVKTTCSLMVGVLSVLSEEMGSTWILPTKCVEIETVNVLDHVHTSWSVLNDLLTRF